MITQAELKQLLHYDPETGHFTRLKTTGRNRWKAGSRAGCLLRSDGYRRILIRGVSHAEHRLAWLYMTGEWVLELDHINRTRDDNRFDNLRPATRAENMWNRTKSRKNNPTSQYMGVSWNKRRGMWIAQICTHDRRQVLGFFGVEIHARNAYQQAKRLQHRHG